MKILCDLTKKAESGMCNRDSGFGNRIIYWVVAYALSDLVGGAEIILQHRYWPELLFLDFPRTGIKKLSRHEYRKLFPLSFNQFEYLIKTKDISILNKEKIYYLADFYLDQHGHDLLRIFDYKWEKYYSKVISKIRFKKPEVENFFKEKFSEVIWIHMRRGVGTLPTKKFLMEMDSNFSKEDVELYWNIYHSIKYGPYSGQITEENFADIEDQIYKITTDEFYLKLIDKVVLKRNKDQKIYISSDIPSYFYSHYYERYEKNIINRNLYFKEFLQFYKEEYFIKERSRIKFLLSMSQVLNNVFDLFVGISSPSVIISDSTWSFIPFLSRQIVSEEKNYIWLRGDSIVENNMGITIEDLK